MEGPPATLPPECYKVEVLHLLNPHLIWVEVRDTAIVSVEEHGIKFEQIGIYGLLPLETTLELDDAEISVQRCPEWVPASATLMRKFIAGETDILFTPIHLDRRFSVFDDNIHKFGDLIVKKRSGNIKSLSNLLRTSGFATYNEDLFLSHLSGGRICTKLNSVDIQKVLTEIEKYYLNKNDPQKTWEKTIKKNTSVVRVSQEFEQALTKTNLDKHNKSMKAILENKSRDLELCKGVDEPSMGRATTRKWKETKRSTSGEKKLVLLQSYKTKADSKDSVTCENTSNEHTQAFEDTKMFLEANSSPYPMKIPSKPDEYKSQILKKVMSKAAIKKVLKEEKMMKKPFKEQKEKIKKPRVVRKSVYQIDESVFPSSAPTVFGSEHNNVIKASNEIINLDKTEAVASNSKPDQQLLNKDDNIVCNNSVTNNQDITEQPVSKPIQEHQENRVSFYNTEERHRRFSKGKALKKVIAEVKTSTVASQGSRKEAQISSTSSSQIQASHQESQNSKRVSELLKDSEIFGSTIISKLKRRGRKYTVATKKAKAYFGPPGINVTTLTRVPPVISYDNDRIKNNGLKTGDKCYRLDSIKDGDSIVGPTADISAISSYRNGNKRVTENVKLQGSEIRKQRHEKKETSSSSSSVWERRLKIHKEMAKNKRCVSQTSDTTNKDSSNVEDNSRRNFIRQNIEEDSDDSISEILEKLGIEKNKKIFTLDTKNIGHKTVYTSHELDVKANPFKNLDINNSVFVDNLVTPVIMVHSKMNKRFTPSYIYRDIHFNAHIRLVLKNLGILRPMLMQTISWNAILRGHSVFMVGSSCSGKSMGYLPAVCRLVSDFNQSDSNCNSVGPFCVIVCATSQSVSDIAKLARMLVGCDEKVVSCYYGYDELAIATSLLNGCDLLISTAPSLVRLLEMTDFGLDLRRLTTLVMDDCERLSDVYAYEIKFCLCSINDMLQSRVNKELNVQYVVASRTWCHIMEPFAKKAPDTVVCIGAFEECVLYSRSNMSVRYVKDGNKLNHVNEFLKQVDLSKRTVIVCDTDKEVEYLDRAIERNNIFIFASNSKMTIQELYTLSKLWKDFRDPLMAPVLVCRDANLYHMNIVDAGYLVHYSMPSLYSTFCRRFATLIESYASIFGTVNNQIKILILLDENNVEQLPKIIRFVKRCTNDIPDHLDELCTAVLTEKDAKKAEKLTPICTALMTLGECPDMNNCKSRHTIFKDYDTPKEWMPNSGMITFKILHYLSAAFYSVRLIGNYDLGMQEKYPSTYSSISLKMGMHYANQKNRILFGVPQVGDICAVALTNNLFSRAQVILIIDTYERGNPKNVLVNLIDEEYTEIVLDVNLYHLPDDLKNLESYVVQVRLANIQPRDKDIVFSDLAVDEVKRHTNDKKGIYMQGNVVLTIGKCIFIDTLDACQDLKSVNQIVVLSNIKSELLEKHAEVNLYHIAKLEKLCKKAVMELPPPKKRGNDIPPPIKVTPKISWAHLDEDMSLVEFGVVEHPNKLFVRLIKFNECLKMLLTDIQKYVVDNTAKIKELIKGDIVLAEYPDDAMYERARIEEIGDETIKCFFVDQGEWRYLTIDKFVPIPDTFITQLPFQAIECRLLGITPTEDQWTDFAMKWLFDKSESSVMKQFFVKYFTKESTQFTGGHKYGVVFIDTYGQEDIILNQVMLDLNLGTKINDEIKFLDLVKRSITCEVKCKEEDDDVLSEKLSKCSTISDCIQKPTSNILLAPPIRSVPLIGTDESDESEIWNINLTEDMAAMFKPMIEKSMRDNQPVLPAIESKDSETLLNVDPISSKSIKQCTPQLLSLKIDPDSSKELDSDDLSWPEADQSEIETLKKVPKEKGPLDNFQLRKPKLNWRQTKTTVIMKILLVGVDTYDLKIQDRALTFSAMVNGTKYGFEFGLYGVIDIKSATHSNKGQYILVKFNKMMRKNWLSLTKDGGNLKWIVYDVDSIDTSSDEEEVQKDSLYNIMKNMHVADSDSDEDIVDDVGHTYK